MFVWLQHGAWVHQADMLEAKFHLSELVLAALERYLAVARGADAAGNSAASAAAAGAAHAAAVQRFVDFLQVLSSHI